MTCNNKITKEEAAKIIAKYPGKEAELKRRIRNVNSENKNANIDRRSILIQKAYSRLKQLNDEDWASLINEVSDFIKKTHKIKFSFKQPFYSDYIGCIDGRSAPDIDIVSAAVDVLNRSKFN